MMRYPYILFDLDGTLTDPAEGICGCIQYALEKDGRSVGPMEEYYPWIGPPLEFSFQEFAGAEGEDVARLVTYYRERFSTVGLFENEMYPGIPELLRELKATGAHLAVATGKPTVYARQILEHFDLLRYFDCVCGISLGGTAMTKADVITEALKQLGQPDTQSCVMVGDRKHDVQGAQATGLTSIGVLYGYGSREELEAAGAGAIAESVEALGCLLLA